MGLTAEQGLPIIINTVRNGVVHRDYDRVCKLAKKYYQLITGEDMDELMRQFSRREDTTLFEQRKSITQHITPSVSSAIMSPFYKVGRVNVIKRDVTMDKIEDFDKVKEVVMTAIDNYYGGKSLDKYLETRFVELSFSDPNSWIITEFDEPSRDEQGNPTEKVKPYPWEVSSTDAINFKFKNNELLWLIVKREVCIKQKYEKKEKDKVVGIDTVDEIGTTYTIYLDKEAIKFTQIPFDGVTIPEDGLIHEVAVMMEGGGFETVQYIRFDQKRIYKVETSLHNAGRVPACRVGYKADITTDARTCVSPMEPGIPYFMKMIKTVSEFDLTMCLHVFPQKIQYVPKCIGESKEIGCDAGRTPAGDSCKVCNGSGQMPTHTSAQDALFLRMPKNPDDMIDLEKLMIYKSPSIELVKFQRDYITELSQAAQKAVFNSDVFSRAEIATTGMEKYIEMDNIYDTLFPFGERFADIWKYKAKVIGALVDAFNLITDYRFPKDFKFKSVDDLLSELKLANDSAAPAYIRQEISRDIAAQQFQDKPEELKRIYVKEKFFPFAGKSSQEIIYIISNNKTTQYNEILWSNFEQIFLELEMEAESIQKYFYDYDFMLQKEKLDAKVNLLITAINSAAPPPSTTF